MHSSLRVLVGGLLWRTCLIAAILSLVGFSAALAAAGDLDPTFHGTGKFKLNMGSKGYTQAVAVQPDGKIVAAGRGSFNIGIVRFTALGALDTTFNKTGKQSTDLGGLESVGGLAINPIGKIIVSGEHCEYDGTRCDAVVLRYNPNGTLDTTFNRTGKRIDDFGGDKNSGNGGVALQPDGKILVGGYMFKTVTEDYDFAVYRYTRNGALDTTFGGTGKVAIGFGLDRFDFVSAVAVYPLSGKIIVAGRTCDNHFVNCDFALARLNPNGSLDRTFSGDGKQITDFGANEEAYAMALQPDGKIVLAGSKEQFGYYWYAVARYNRNGSPDTTFAGDGKTILAYSDGVAQAVAVQPSDGKIVVCGGAFRNFALVRFTSTGRLDKTFRGTGKQVVDFGASDSCYAMALQPTDGKYILAGATEDRYGLYWAIARVLP